MNNRLIDASQKSHIEIIKLLLEEGADPYIKNKIGQSFLMMVPNKCYTLIIDVFNTFNTKDMTLIKRLSHIIMDVWV